MKPLKLCAVSVDVDPLTAYYQIHGLGEPPHQVLHTIARHALPRFEELLAEAGIQATFFVVGRELEASPETQQVMSRLAGAGHEIGNHTYSHPYNLCRLDDRAIANEIFRAHETIANLIGTEHAPVGFRSPGYFLNGKVLRALADLGYRYDSSMFPSPPYYLAKAAAMAGMMLRGRRSGAILGDPRNLTSPLDPYRPDMDQPWRRGEAPLIELPVAVIPRVRIPAIGTLLAISPGWLRRRVLQQMADRPFFNLELHGIDLADAVADRIPTELAGRQPDLRVPAEDKRRILLESLTELKQTFEMAPLRDVARRLAGQLPSS